LEIGLSPLAFRPESFKKTNIGQRYILNQISKALKREVFDFEHQMTQMHSFAR
jgi:hypothetical protein